MLKETLTKLRAAQDLKNYSTEIIVSAVVTIIFIIVALSLLFYWFNDLPIYYFFATAPIVAIAISAFFTAIKQAYVLYRACKKKFYITTSVLTASYQRQGWRSLGLLGSTLFRKPNRLIFSNYGEYSIPDTKNYKWSKKHCMNADSVYDYALRGDEFYLVIIDNKILYAYSTKLFELEK